MKAMIFAAGLGTRLIPLTSEKPKALVPVNGKPLLQIQIEKLKTFGIKQIIVNAHHYAEQIEFFLKSNNNFGLEISLSDESGELLNTGGGLKNASSFFDDGKPFLVHNVDIITNINIYDMLEFHQANNCLATLAVRNRVTKRYFLFNENNMLVGWENLATGEKIITRETEKYYQSAFSGVHIINPEIFNLMPKEKSFSIIDVYLQNSSKEHISGFKHNNDYWFDIGTVEKLSTAENFLKSN